MRRSRSQMWLGGQRFRPRVRGGSRRSRGLCSSQLLRTTRSRNPSRLKSAPTIATGCRPSGKPSEELECAVSVALENGNITLRFVGYRDINLPVSIEGQRQPVRGIEGSLDGLSAAKVPSHCQATRQWPIRPCIANHQIQMTVQVQISDRDGSGTLRRLRTEDSRKSESRRCLLLVSDEYSEDDLHKKGEPGESPSAAHGYPPCPHSRECRVVRTIR
jgi:hypothetical protein